MTRVCLPDPAQLRAALAHHAPQAEPAIHIPPARRAAVLVPLTAHPPGVLLTRRAGHLRRHPGEVAFPGGMMDPTDAHPEAAALREANEEIGLRATDVYLVGRLPQVFTASDVHVTPVVGLIDSDVRYELAPGEVDCVFVLPMDVLRNPASPQQRQMDWQGVSHNFWVWPHAEQYIWGATASILIELAAVLATLPTP